MSPAYKNKAFHERLTGVIAVGLAVSLSANAICNHLDRPGTARIVAQVQYGPLAYPPTIAQLLLQASESWDQERERALQFVSENSDLSPLDFYDDYQWMSTPGFPVEFIKLLRPQDWPEGYYSIQVVNEGNVAADWVKINVPDGDLATVERAGETVTSVIDGVVELGIVSPLEEIPVVVWTDHPPSVFDAEEVTVVFDDGVGDVQVKAWVDLWIFKVTFFMDFLSRMFLNKFVVVGLVVALTLYALGIFMGRKGTKDAGDHGGGGG
jgi:hypothetical protein